MNFTVIFKDLHNLQKTLLIFQLPSLQGKSSQTQDSQYFTKTLSIVVMLSLFLIHFCFLWNSSFLPKSFFMPSTNASMWILYFFLSNLIFHLPYDDSLRIALIRHIFHLSLNHYVIYIFLPLTSLFLYLFFYPFLNQAK